MSSESIISTKDLSKVYGSGPAQVQALDCVNIGINENEFVAIMGPSGSGKSTLMNILGCLDKPTSGKYFLAGQDVSEFNKAKLAEIRNTRIGFVFQSYNLLPNTSAIENVMLPLLYRRENYLNPEEHKKKAMIALEAVGLADRVHHKPQELSGGQMQRVAIARALINDPLLILADEPTGNLDTNSGEEIMALISDLHQQGSTIVMVTHEEYIAAVAERVIRFRNGQIEFDQNNGTRRSVNTEKENVHASI